MVWVEDSLQALQELAAEHRQHFNFPVVGLTGSNGKTTTKELIHRVLSRRFQVHATSGNLNNHIGVPLTLLAMPEQTEVAIVEMGANHVGEIASLCRIAQPTHGLVTNIGKAHLEGFGGLEGVKKGKSELYRYLAEQRGVAFVNRNEPFLTGLSSPVEKRIFYRVSDNPSPEEPDYEVQLQADHPTLKVSFLDEYGGTCYLETRLSGSHNLANLVTAITLGKYFKVPGKEIVAALEGYEPDNNRSQWIHWKGNRVFLDAYNANPTSMQGAIDFFGKQMGGPTMLVLGSMLELGEYSDEEHEKVLEHALEHDPDRVILVGEEFESASASLSPPHLFFRNREQLEEWFQQESPTGFLILLKGSRGIGLEELVREPGKN